MRNIIGLGAERLSWYAVETVDTIAALRSLHRQGFAVDDGRNGEVVQNIPLASERLPGFEVWRPMALIQRKRRVRGKRHEELVPERRSLLPGYLLVRFDVRAQWQWILDLNGVGGVLSLSDHRFPDMPPKPYALDTDKVEALRQEIIDNGGALRVDEEGRRIGINVKPSLLYAVGSRLRVTDGPFTSHYGEVIEKNVMTSDAEKRDGLKLLIDFFGRATPISLAVAQVEPA